RLVKHSQRFRALRRRATSGFSYWRNSNFLTKNTATFYQPSAKSLPATEMSITTIFWEWHWLAPGGFQRQDRLSRRQLLWPLIAPISCSTWGVSTREQGTTKPP